MNVVDREPARVLLHSQRGLFSDVHYRLGLHEFEDIIREVDAVDMVTPRPTAWFPNGTRLANRLAMDFSVSVNPGILRDRVAKDYDLFFAVVQFPKDLLHIEYLDGWKDRCKTSVCWLNEIWIPDIARTRHFLKTLARFDHVILHWSGSVRPVQDIIQKPCSYLPYGINALEFSPYPHPPKRVVDVYSIGRRSPVTHQALLKLTTEKDFFYLYDTINGFQVSNPAEHRRLVASTAKRSRFFIVNPGKADNFSETGGQVEFGNRFFEGAASGTIMIGETPTNDQFAKVFDWPEAVVHLPFNSDSIGDVIDMLNRDPQRQERIRTANVVNSLRKHDWVYRWQSVLEIAGLAPLAGLARRQQRLAGLAATVEQETVNA